MTRSKSLPWVETFREKQERLNRKRKDYYVTDDEHKYLKEKLKEYRNESITKSQ